MCHLSYRGGERFTLDTRADRAAVISVVADRSPDMATGRTNVRRMSPVFRAWLTIRSRDPFCECWASFEQFCADVGERPDGGGTC